MKIERDERRFNFHGIGLASKRAREASGMTQEQLPYNDDINDTVDEKVIQTEISEIFRVDTSDMLPVGKKFKIDIKNFHETRNYR